MSLLSRWKLDDGAGIIAADSVGAHDGALINFVGNEWSLDRRIGDGCLVFDAASTQYVESAAAPVAAGDLSIKCWFKTTQGGDNVAILTRNIPTFKWLLYKNNAGKLCFDNVDGVSINSNTVINDGLWHMVIVTKIGDVTTLYIDNSSKGSSNTPWLDAVGTIQFGHLAQWGAVGYYTGSMDEVDYYDHGLSADERDVLFNTPMSRRVGNGKDYASLSAAVAAFYALATPLAENRQFLLDGGLVEGNGTDYLEFSNKDSINFYNGHYLEICPYPGDELDPPLIKYRFKNEDDYTNIDPVRLSKLKIVSDCTGGGSAFVTSNSGGSFRVSDCVHAVKLDHANFGDYNEDVVYMFNSTLAITCVAWAGTLDLVNTEIKNSVIACNSDQNVEITSSLWGDHNTFYNYQAGKTVVVNVNWTNSTFNQNPNFVGGAVITVTNENPVTVMGRNFALRSISAACISGADPATATPKDILGHARG